MISVIVPVYNTEKYLRRCIDSILAQTYSDFELILIDDGSPDSCGAICDGCAKKDDRITVLHKENGGVSSARNAGLDWAFEHSDSDWITFIDSDDWVHPKYLEALYKAVIENCCSISVCSFTKTDDDGFIPAIDTINNEFISSEDFYCNYNTNSVVAWGKIYAKDFFKDIRYPLGVIHEDEFVTYKLMFQCHFIAFVPSPLYCVCKNESSITRSAWTPARLSALQGKQEQIRYMKKKGYDKAYRRAIFDYAQVTYWQLWEIKNDSQYQKEKNICENN